MATSSTSSTSSPTAGSKSSLSHDVTISRPLISGRFDPNDFVSRLLPPNHNQPSELEADEMNSTVIDGLGVRHYHTHHNNQTYNIYVSGDLPTSVPAKEEDESFSTHNAEAPTNIEASFPKTKPPKTYAFPAKNTLVRRPYPVGSQQSVRSGVTQQSLMSELPSTSRGTVVHQRSQLPRIPRRKLNPDHVECLPCSNETDHVDATITMQLPRPQEGVLELERTSSGPEQKSTQDQRFHENFNRQLFNIDVEGNGLDGKPPIVPRSSQQLTNESYQRLLEICFAKQSGDAERWRVVLQKYHTRIYEVAKNYTAEVVTLPSGEKVPKLFFQGRLAVPQREVFMAIRDCHASRSRHTKQQATFAAVSDMYCNITQKMVNTYIAMCPTCIRRPPVIKPLKGAASPIMSSAFRDRFQVDLVDMQKEAQEDVRGVTCRYIVVLKDHFTRQEAVRKLPIAALGKTVGDSRPKRKRTFEMKREELPVLKERGTKKFRRRKWYA